MINKFARLAGACLAAGLCSVAFSASMTVTFAPPTAVDATSVTATVNYAGVAATGNGTQVVVCYDNTKLTFGAVTYANPPGETQPSQEQAAGPLCVGPANRQILLNYVSLGGTWPSNPAGSGTLAASGSLAAITFTTSTPFTGSTAVVATENTAAGGDYTLGNATGTLTRTVTPSTAVFSIGNVTVTEAGAAANAVVTCTGAFASNTVTPVTVAFSTTNAAGNFTTTASPVSFTACGGQTQNIAVTPRVDDAVVQGTVTGTIVLGAITTDVGATISNGTSTVTVNDNDTPPVFSLAKAGACAEPATNCTFTITRDSGVATATTVNFAVSGSATRSTTGAAASGDYYLALTACAPANVIAGTSVSHPNASPLVINMCVLDDLAVEGTEAATLTLTANPPTYTVGTAAQTQNIADDDSPQTVSVAVTGSPASENGGVLTYTFTRAGGSAAAQAATLAVNITPPAASGRYSTTCTSPQTFAAATATKTCTVTGINDALLNGNVNVVVGVAAPTVASDYTVGAPATATGVIADDEVGVSVAAVSGVITEGGLATFTISCTGVATTSVPFTLTGTVGTDVVGGATSPIALVCGTPQTVTVQTAQNTISGDGRSLTLTLGTPTGGNAALVPGQSASTVAVLDDDGPKIVPTMGMLGLGLMSLMLAGLAAFQRRRSMK